LQHRAFFSDLARELEIAHLDPDERAKKRGRAATPDRARTRSRST